MSNDESTLRARNIERPVPPELDNARDLMRELEQRERRKVSAQLVFGQTPPSPKQCIVCKGGRFAWKQGAGWICLDCEQAKARKGRK